MPAIEPGDLVLVTGASGFIPVNAVKAFLSQGYPVRGTVRSVEKGEYLKRLFRDEKAAFEYVIVKEVAEEGAFDEAVKGVGGVAHMASPVITDSQGHPDELAIPAVNGTLGILKSLKKNNPTVKRVVMTSSTASVINSEAPPPRLFNEADWNPVSIPRCDQLGEKAPGQDKYRASKIRAEKAFWEWFEDETPSFDGVALCPPLVLGPILQDCKSADQINSSVRKFYRWMSGQMSQAQVEGVTGSFVHVRDCALAHVRALTVPDASMQRFITSAGRYSANDFCCTINKLLPDLKDVPRGDKTLRNKIHSGANHMDGSKCAKVLGIQYMGLDETLEEMVLDLHDKFGP